MAIPPGSTPFVPFGADPLTLLLRGADSTPRFVSPELAAPGSTADVAFDTSPPLWFDFPAVTSATSPVPRAAATVSASGRPSHGPRETRRRATPKAGRHSAAGSSALAATGGSESGGLLGIAVLALAWAIRRRNRGTEPAGRDS